MARHGVKRITGYLLVLMVTLTVSIVWASSSLDVKKALFQKADQLMLEADTNKTRFFAPKTFENAINVYKSAENDYAKERSIKDINDKLDQSIVLFKSAIKISDEAEKLFRNTDLARNDAHKVMASKYKPAQWTEAENMFKRAIIKYEYGDNGEAWSLSQMAESIYRQAEKDTVIYSYLAGVWETLKKIEAIKGNEHLVPKTYAHAMELAQQAEAELDRQTYGNEKAKTLIKEAISEAEYGLKLSQCIKTLKDEGKTMEDLFLEDLIPQESLEKINHKS